MVRVGKQGRFRTAVRCAYAILVAFCTASLLGSCYFTGGSVAPADVGVIDKVNSLDISPRQAQAVSNAQSNVGQRAHAAVFEGTEISEVGDVPARPAAAWTDRSHSTAGSPAQPAIGCVSSSIFRFAPITTASSHYRFFAA